MPLEVGHAGFRVQFFGYQFPDSDDFWDGNWLTTEISCETENARINFRDNCIRNVELRSFEEQLQSLNDRRAKSAELQPMEPYVAWRIATQGSLGQLSSEIGLKPGCDESHSFVFTIDRSYIPPLVQQIRSVLYAYPVRGEP